jgi:hypothetical protein
VREDKRELWERNGRRKGLERSKCAYSERERDMKKNQRRKISVTLFLPFIVLPDGHQFMHTVSAHLLLLNCYCCIIVLLYYCVVVLLYYCIIVLLYYCIIVLLYYCQTISHRN